MMATSYSASVIPKKFLKESVLNVIENDSMNIELISKFISNDMIFIYLCVEDKLKKKNIINSKELFIYNYMNKLLDKLKMEDF